MPLDPRNDEFLPAYRRSELLLFALVLAAAVACKRTTFDASAGGPGLFVERDEVVTGAVDVIVSDDQLSGYWTLRVLAEGTAGRPLGNPMLRMRVFDAETGELVGEASGRQSVEVWGLRDCEAGTSCSARFDVEFELEAGASADIAWSANVQASFDDVESTRGLVTVGAGAP